MTFLVSLGTAVGAAVLALAGNYVLHAVQTKARLREERREFVRSLHAETVAVVVDLNLFVRSIRADAIGGTMDREATDQRIETGWDDDLHRRVLHIEYGHPDPDVRQAAEAVDDAMWPFITAARRPDEPEQTFPPPMTQEQRSTIHAEMEAALAEFRRSVYLAPNRDTPTEVRYDGSPIPSRFWRSVEAETRANQTQRE